MTQFAQDRVTDGHQLSGVSRVVLLALLISLRTLHVKQTRTKLMIKQKKCLMYVVATCDLPLWAGRMSWSSELTSVSRFSSGSGANDSKNLTWQHKEFIIYYVRLSQTPPDSDSKHLHWSEVRVLSRSERERVCVCYLVGSSDKPHSRCHSSSHCKGPCHLWKVIQVFIFEFWVVALPCEGGSTSSWHKTKEQRKDDEPLRTHVGLRR